MKKRFLQNKRGVSPVIGAIFFVLIFMAGFSMMLWQVNQYESYAQVVNDRAEFDWEKQNELLEIVEVNVVDGYLNMSVTSKGAVTAHIIALWITNTTAENWHKRFSLDRFVNPGDTVTNIGQTLGSIAMPQDFCYDLKLITERGNIITIRYGLEEDGESPSVKAFGVFSLDWFYFKFSSKTFPAPTSAGSVAKNDDYVSFYLKVTNNYDETISLHSASLIMLLVEWQEPHLNIVQNVSYPLAWSTDWDRTTSQDHFGSYSMHAGSSDTDLTSYAVDTSNADSVTISFWYRDDDVDDSDDVYLQFWDGSTFDNIFEIGKTSPEDTWHFYTVTTTDSQYFASDFRINFRGSGIDYGENLWIDDVLISKNVGGDEETLLSDGFEQSSASDPTITAYDDVDPIVIGPHGSKILIFAAENAGLDSWSWTTEMPYYQAGTEGAIVMAALVFTMSSDPDQLYGQSLPFQGLVLTD